MPDSKPGTDTRDEQGRYSAEVSTRDLLEAVEEHSPAGTSEVAEAVGLARQSTDYRLRRLAEAGKVTKKKVGGTLVWSLAEALPASEADETARRDVDGDRPTGGASDDTPTLRERVEALGLQGNGSLLEARKDAVVAVLERLREKGRVDVGELKELADTFDHGYSDGDSFWTNLRRQSVFAELDVVETPGRGGKKYTWVEPGTES